MPPRLLSIHWIPSEFDASDAESRQQTHPEEHSALARHMISQATAFATSTIGPCLETMSGVQRVPSDRQWLTREVHITHKQCLPTSERELEDLERSKTDRACDCGRGPVSVGAFFLLSFFPSSFFPSSPLQAKRLRVFSTETHLLGKQFDLSPTATTRR